MSNDLLYSGSISAVQFHLAGSEEIAQGSYVTVRNHERFRNTEPYPYGVYDARLGTTGDYKCQTCLNNKKNCIGHPGEIILNYPIINPIAIDEILKWLKSVCHYCGELLVDESKLSKHAAKIRLDNLPAITRGKNRKCESCGELQPNVKRDDESLFTFITEMFGEEQRDVKDKRAVTTEKLYPHHVKLILERISDKTVKKLGKNPISHPRNFVLHRLYVPAVNIRPDSRTTSTSQATSDDLTTLLHDIIKKNNIMPTVLPDAMNDAYIKTALDMNTLYYKFVRDSGENSVASIANRLKGKHGRFRKNMLGKRVRNMARSTITGDPTIGIDEVGVPLVFAQTIQIETVVQEYNKHILATYVKNGRTYPGATKIRKARTGVEYDIDPNREIELEIGDTVIHDVIDGESVGFNRQPSLTMSNISMHRVRVTRNPKIRTIRMNVLATPLYNADFDGDQMNLIFATDTAARNELSQLSKVPNWLISHASSSPSLGQVDDSIIGTAELTRSGVVLNKYHAMLLFANTTILPDFSDVGTEGISGRDCFSKLLEETPINYSATPTYYDPQMAPYIKYDPTETKVFIDKGRLITGVLDKKSIGKGARGGIYHIIANEFGRDQALDAMFNTQQIAIAFTLHQGFTIGMMDIQLPKETHAKIAEISADMINKSRLITERLNNGEIIPPIGKTVEEYFEDMQINTLKIYDEYTEPVMSAVNLHLNNLVKLVMFGSKGKIEHLFNMVSNGGQKLINGERIRQQFGFKRTLPYYPRFDTSPESRGYIASSYAKGMSSTEYIPNAMASRFDLISKALTTAVTGYLTRKSVLNMQSIITNNFRWALKNARIIQFSYGEDYLDASRVERVHFPTAHCSDEALKKFSHESFPELFAQILEDRKYYREHFKRLEEQSRNEMMSDYAGVPANIERIIRDITREYEDALKEPNLTTLKIMCGMVTRLCAELPRLLMYSESTAEPTDFMKASVRLTAMLCRSLLNPNALVNLKMTPEILQYIIDKVKYRYRQALIEPGTAVGTIAAQSFSEPLTQYMLDAHHRSASGGTSTNVTSLANDILGVKKTDEMSFQTMFIQVLPQYEGDRAKVQEIANNIEVMRFERFVSSWHIFYENFGEPTHREYIGEKTIIQNFIDNNPLLRPPSDLTKWVIRFAINKTTMILKNMTIEMIIMRLRLQYPDMYFVYTPENSEAIIIRAYIRAVAFKSTITLKLVRTLKDAVLQHIIRGVSGIHNANVVKLIRTKVNADGSISAADNLWAISTIGTNVAGVLRLKYVDRDRVHSNSIVEMSEIFGVEAGRQRVIAGLKNLVATSYRHYLCYADEMSYAGIITGIEISGLKTRDTNNIMLRVGFGSSLGTIKEASINAMEDKISGLGCLMVGSIPKHGTLYNSVSINQDFIRENVKQPDEIILEGLLS